MFLRKTQRVISGLFSVGGTALSWAVRIFATVMLIAVVTVLFLALIFTLYIKYDLQPGLELELTDIDLAESSQIVCIDKTTGEEIELQTIYSEENRIWVKYDQLNPYLIDAAISIEDQRFERHQGVDWHRTAGAFVTMFLSMSNSFGGSTITQQLIKNLTQEDDVTVQRKLTEIFKAIEFERRYTKNTIMEWYLNTIYFGEQCNGAQTAALKYFGKDVWDLTLAECASLIGITNNPSLYDPYISEKTREANKERQENVLWAMLEVGKIDRAEYDEAMAQTLVFTSKEAEVDDSHVYSWYEDQVIYEVTQDLADKMGITYKAASLMLTTGGYKIYATIDPEIQAIVDEVYSDLSNLPGYTSRYNQQLQSSMSIIEPSTGNVVALAGGVGEKNQSLIWNRATQSTRSPGSSIKPITVYAPAIEEGLITPVSVYDDTPLLFDSPDAENGLYPKNQSGGYRGLTTVKYAVQASLNTVAVKIVDQMGPEVSYRYATEEFGLTTLVESRQTDSGYTFSDIGLSSMALGGLTDGVSVTELSAAYATFANDGYYNAPRTYTHVVNSKGDVVLDNSAAAVEALSQRTTYYMNQLLTNVVQNGTGTRARLDNMTVAGKTGTTSDDHDRWFVGYTPYYAAAVWVGFDTPEEVRVDSSTNPALAMWRLVMEKVHANLEFADFTNELETQTASVCLDSGLLATNACKSDVRGSRAVASSFIKGEAPKTYCTMHVEVDYCSEGKHLANEYCPEDARTKVGMVNYLRDYPKEDVVVADQQYMVGHIYKQLEEGHFTAACDTNTPANAICDIHDETTYQPPVEYPFWPGIGEWGEEDWQWPGYYPGDEQWEYPWGVLPEINR